MPTTGREQSPAPEPDPQSSRPAEAADGAKGWHGRLRLRFEAGPLGTRLVHNRHEGPLRLLKALPSGDGRRLEAVIIHPPGGLVGGDSLAIELEAGVDARVLATTPGAQKWYRSESTAVASTRLALAAGAMLEWLPQPAILFDCARARQVLAIDMDPTAACVGWEALVRGRAAMGERAAGGDLEQMLTISVAGALRWQERLQAAAGDRLFASSLGWGGRRIAASVWCCAPALATDRLRDLRDAWRALLQPPGADAALPLSGGGATPLSGGATSSLLGGATIAAEGLLLAKLLADDSEQLMSLCQALWRAARIALEGGPGSAPRIWQT